jgi:hypothetical protein
MKRTFLTISVFLVSAVLVACASTPARNPVPAELTSQVGIEGVPEARFWADEWPRFSIERFETYSAEDFQKHFPAIYKKTHSYLAISGGGANGAFGAGLFAGWTESGSDRSLPW